MTSNQMLSDVLAFLKDTHQADVVAAAEWDKMTRGRLPFTEEHQAMKTFRRREALIARLEAVTPETSAAHERELEEVMKERDYAQDVLQDVHIVLGGDGEWKGRLPPQEPPDSGDLHLDVPALARERMAELACWHEQCTGKHGSQMPCVASVKTPSATDDPHSDLPVELNP